MIVLVTFLAFIIMLLAVAAHIVYRVRQARAEKRDKAAMARAIRRADAARREATHRWYVDDLVDQHEQHEAWGDAG